MFFTLAGLSTQHVHLVPMLPRSGSTATIGSTGWVHFLVPFSPFCSTVYSRCLSTRLPTWGPMAMVAMRSITSTVLQASTKNAAQRVRQIITPDIYQHTDDLIARGTGATDGTSDSMDFASRIRGAKHGPHRDPAADHQTESASLSEPMPAFHPGHDGHHSQSALGSSTRQHKEMSDRSYHSGPSIESGSS